MSFFKSILKPALGGGLAFAGLKKLTDKDDPAPPDPRLVEAQLRSMGYQDEAIKQTMDLLQRQQAANESLMPLQREALQFSLDSGKTAFEQSQSDRNWLLERRGALTGLQDKMIAEANAFDPVAEGERRAAAATAGVGQAVSQQREASARTLASMGVTPNSGRMESTMRKTGIDAARLGVGAANEARFGARNEGRMLVDRASNALAGYPAQATGTAGMGAGIGAGQITLANQGAGGINAGYGAMTGTAQAAGGLAGGLASNAIGMYGAQGNYNLAAHQQSGQDLAALGALLAGGAQMYGAAGSERRLKEGIERVGTHPELGVGLYRFRYKAPYRARWGHGDQLGVMVEELQAVLPEAIGITHDGYKVVNYAMV
jgi:hypothetical protein